MAKKQVLDPNEDRAGSFQPKPPPLAMASRVQHDLLQAVFAQSPDSIYVKDTQGRFLAANDAAARAHCVVQSQELIGKTVFDLLPLDVAEAITDAEHAMIASSEPILDAEEEQVAQNGNSRWLLSTKFLLKDSAGEILGICGIDKDITANKRAETEWKNERKQFRVMIDQVPDYLFAKDKDSRFTLANQALAADVGLLPDDLIGKTDFDIHENKLARKFFDDEQDVITSGKPSLDIEEYVIGPSGDKKWLSTSKVPLHDEKNETIGIVGVSRNITDRKLAEDQIRHMALHDGLTGLPNRTLLMDRLTQAILLARRSGDVGTAIFLDLDNFKPVNDILGHSAGDTLLKTVAARMVKCVRATDTVARLGGDEFVVLLSDKMDSPEGLMRVVEQIRAAIAEPIRLEKQKFRVTCSMGLASFPQDGTDANTVLANADLAMYQAKQSGRNRYEFYKSGMKDKAKEQRTIERDLREAIVGNELTLHYQPQVDLKTGHIFALEALVRWRHPKLGILPPAKFIGLAEECGLIVDLGKWVLRESCRQNKAWQNAGIDPIIMCVNVSAREFREKNWAAGVRDILQETGMDPKYLELELTESMLMRDVKQAVATMQELQPLGVRFTIDDFGTGYSSLSALKDLPVARLKIDKSFIDDLPNNSNNEHITKAMISLGRKLNMKVIAEGVETAEQLAFLQKNKCSEIQGFYFSKPIDAEATAKILGSALDPNQLFKSAPRRKL